ncbi:YkgJ family cysteine cluster protein [Methanococcoides methylutens]|uniref:YkgJ family cysteine cluster protein n=1 Tax=Methanococcoides methylutens TaxID=2226 RepID=UPI0010846383|nr:YkgJ family cysteine cluster protein [Methanococcoides methylutens]
MFSNYRQSLIKGLQEELEAAGSILIEDIASQIREIGFSCRMCGTCCKRSGGDNRVFLTSVDMEMLEGCSTCPKDAAIPMLPDGMDMYSSSSVREHLHEFELDSKGRLNTFGWMLKRKESGDCLFLGYDGEVRGEDDLCKDDLCEGDVHNRCSIYANRSMLCRTYPFYIDNGELNTSECEGLGEDISYEDSIILARDLIDRYVTEIKDTILLYENFEEIQTSSGSLDIFNNILSGGDLVFVVHDCTGMSIFSLKLYK